MSQTQCYIEKSQLPNGVKPTPIHLIKKSDFKTIQTQQTPHWQAWAHAVGFTACSQNPLIYCNSDGEREAVFACVENLDDRWVFAKCAEILPTGYYSIQTDLSAAQTELAQLSWGLGRYSFNCYKNNKSNTVQQIPNNQTNNQKNNQNIDLLAMPSNSTRVSALAPVLVMDDSDGATGGVDRTSAGITTVQAALEAVYLIRDLINRGPADLNPTTLGDCAEQLAADWGAECTRIVGADLLVQNYPAIHAVGRASVYPPELIDLSWGDLKHPKVTLIGKGVCFDSGGLDIKTASGMRTMKKDMAGGAHVLGLAHMIIKTGLPVRLRVLISAVENAVSGNSYHPGDVITMRSGLSVEIHNTDAEGRLIVADALTRACEEKPDLLVDFTTLTGAARVAVGTDIAAFFTNNDVLSSELLKASDTTHDLLWRLPLYQPYKDYLKSTVADLSNASSTSWAGAITAALFLQSFVDHEIDWVHIDMMAANETKRPGRPEGGEANAIHAVFSYLRARFL